MHCFNPRSKIFGSTFRHPTIADVDVPLPSGQFAVPETAQCTNDLATRFRQSACRGFIRHSLLKPGIYPKVPMCAERQRGLEGVRHIMLPQAVEINNLAAETKKLIVYRVTQGTTGLEQTQEELGNCNGGASKGLLSLTFKYRVYKTPAVQIAHRRFQILKCLSDIIHSI